MVREYKWTPDTIDSLFLDDIDHQGILFWFEDVEDMISDIKKTNTQK